MFDLCNVPFIYSLLPLFGVTCANKVIIKFLKFSAKY